MINLVVSLPFNSGLGVFMNVSVYNNNDNNYYCYYVTCEIFALQGCYAVTDVLRQRIVRAVLSSPIRIPLGLLDP